MSVRVTSALDRDISTNLKLSTNTKTSICKKIGVLACYLKSLDNLSNIIFNFRNVPIPKKYKSEIAIR